MVYWSGLATVWGGSFAAFDNMVKDKKVIVAFIARNLSIWIWNTSGSSPWIFHSLEPFIVTGSCSHENLSMASECDWEPHQSYPFRYNYIIGLVQVRRFIGKRDEVRSVEKGSFAVPPEWACDAKLTRVLHVISHRLTDAETSYPVAYLVIFLSREFWKTRTPRTSLRERYFSHNLRMVSRVSAILGQINFQTAVLCTKPMSKAHQLWTRNKFFEPNIVTKWRRLKFIELPARLVQTRVHLNRKTQRIENSNSMVCQRGKKSWFLNSVSRANKCSLGLCICAFTRWSYSLTKTLAIAPLRNRVWTKGIKGLTCHSDQLRTNYPWSDILSNFWKFKGTWRFASW